MADSPSTMPSDGYHLARLDEEQIAGAHHLERHRREMVVFVAVGVAWGAREQRPQLPLGPCARPRLERPATGQHDRDDCPGQVFAHGERSDVREGRDEVDNRFSLPETEENPRLRG